MACADSLVGVLGSAGYHVADPFALGATASMLCSEIAAIAQVARARFTDTEPINILVIDRVLSFCYLLLLCICLYGVLLGMFSRKL